MGKKKNQKVWARNKQPKKGKSKKYKHQKKGNSGQEKNQKVWARNKQPKERESLRNKQQKKGKSGQEKNLTTKPVKRKV